MGFPSRIPAREQGAVVPQDCPPGTDTGKDTLSSPGEAGEEVRLNKALCQQKLRFGGNSVYTHGSAGGKCPQIDHIFGVVAVMDNNVLVVENLVPQLGL